MMEDLFRERQRKAICDLVELTAHRGSAEKSIVQAYEFGISSNQGEFERKRDEIQRRFDVDTAETTDTYDREKSRIEKEIAAEQAQSQPARVKGYEQIVQQPGGDQTEERIEIRDLE